MAERGALYSEVYKSFLISWMNLLLPLEPAVKEHFEIRTETSCVDTTFLKLVYMELQSLTTRYISPSLVPVLNGYD